MTENLPEVSFKPDFVEIRLKKPIEVAERIERIRIKHMTAKHYRNLRSEMGSRAEQFELLESLSGLATSEIDQLGIDDLGACLGVVNSFFLQLHGKSMEYTQSSLKPFLQLLQGNSIQ
jgi:hypothetical protein